MRAFFVILALVSSLGAQIGFSAEVKELSNDVSYLRLRSLSDATTRELPAQATVVDLRGASAISPESLQTLRGWVASSGQLPLRLYLVNSTTHPSIFEALALRQRYALTLAAASPAVTTDIAVTATPEQDRRAWEALDAGTPFKDVLAVKVEKRRYDEAAMVRDHLNGVPIPDSPPDTSDPAPVSPPTPPSISPQTPSLTLDQTPAPAPKSPVIYDAVLQRALHVYQALKALKKLE